MTQVEKELEQKKINSDIENMDTLKSIVNICFGISKKEIDELFKADPFKRSIAESYVKLIYWNGVFDHIHLNILKTYDERIEKIKELQFEHKKIMNNK